MWTIYRGFTNNLFCKKEGNISLKMKNESVLIKSRRKVMKSSSER